MAAFDTPWMSSMSASPGDAARSIGADEPPVVAAFSPNSSAATSYPRHFSRRTIIVHTKSPLLLATPPQVTRALAYSYPFLHPLSRVAGLLSWSTGDPWESFLLLAAFWFVVLYGDTAVRWAGPLLFVAALMLAMYARRFSSLSSSRRSPKTSSPAVDKGKKRSSSSVPAQIKRDSSDHPRHPKSLDEIVAALQQFTTRCNILLDPFMRLTDFLSTQVTATTATTRPALIALFTRLSILSPVWFALTLWPLYIVTTRRVVLAVGTIILSWHSRPARVSRALLWRSRTVRRVCEMITGLSLNIDSFADSSAPRGVHSVKEIEKSIAASQRNEKSKSGAATISAEGIRFTFSLYENQRRWIGIGWTASMLAYERAAWTDDQLNPAPPKEQFKLPSIEGGAAKWRWADGSDWEVDLDGAEKEAAAASAEAAGPGSAPKTPGSPRAGTSEEASWIYYDNKWLNGRRGIDGWGRYTRRRKWVRDAELVEASPNEEVTPTASPGLHPSAADTADVPVADLLNTEASSSTTASRAIPKISNSHSRAASSLDSNSSIGNASGSDQSRKAQAQRRSWFGRRKRSDSATTVSSVASGTTLASDIFAADDAASHKGRDEHEDDGYIPLQYRGKQGQDWGMGDDVGMELG